MPTRIALGVLTVVGTIIYMANRPIQIPMFYDFFIKPFKQGDIMMIVAITLLLVVFAIMMRMAYEMIIYEIEENQWEEIQPFEHECTLINKEYVKSTLHTQLMPMMIGKAMMMQPRTVGHPDMFITKWMYGDDTLLIVDNKELYDLPEGKHRLLLKEKDGEIRIIRTVTMAGM